VAEIRCLIQELPARETESKSAKNPPAFFLLSPPRSGSTLLRIMLAGHPGLFAPPELELLSFNTLRERQLAFDGRYSFWLEGTVRAIMEARGLDATPASAVMRKCEEDNLTTQEFYRLLQQWIGGKTLVDKTPSYALDLRILERAETDFANARYIHLIRHPQGMVRSFKDARLDQVFFVRYKHQYPVCELAELIWVVSQQNILTFLQQVPDYRQFRVRFEDLVSRPELVARDMCRFLGIEFFDDMLRPYDGNRVRMTDGIHPLSKMVGDVRFYEHSRIDPAVASRWQASEGEYCLGTITRKLAESLGYSAFEDQPEGNGASPRPAVRAGSVPIQVLPRGAKDIDDLLAEMSGASDEEAESILQAKLRSS